MENNNIDLCKLTDVKELSLLDIDIEIIATLIKRIKEVLTANRIKTNNLSVCYQRFGDKSSILGVKLSPGSDDDINNYMFLGCTPDESEHCDIYIHSEAKSAGKASSIINLISQDFISFFECFEGSLRNKGLNDIELSFKASLDEHPAKKSSLKSLIKRIIPIK